MRGLYQEGEGWDTIDRFNPLMFLFTYPHIRKEKDGIPLIGLIPSCFSLPIHISGRRRNMRELNRSMVSHPSPS
jgi:hypothetical protein